MVFEIKSFLDKGGIFHLWHKIANTYVSNENLSLVIDAIDEIKADKLELEQYLKKEDYIAGETDLALSSILSMVYPVGAIYISTNSINPNILFGFGEWEQIEDKFLLATGKIYPANTEGGESEHLLTIEELPPHTHNHDPAVLTAATDEQNGFLVGQATNKQYTKIASLSSSSETGLGQPHNNMPPYLTVYIWKRIS